MGDEALRALERDARARPDDRAAAWAYARGLERAGERRALWLELCRMSRAGDDDASRAVDGWVPGLGGTTPPVLASLRAPKVERVSLVRDRALFDGPVHDFVPLLDGRGLALAGSVLLAIDPAREEIVWRQEGVTELRPCGDDALVLGREGTLFLRRGDRTDVAAAGLVGAGAVEEMASWGDRTVVRRSRGADSLVQVIDGSALGRVLWQAPGELLGCVTRSTVFLLEDGVAALEAREVETGTSRWRAELRLDPERPFWWEGDDGGVVTLEERLTSRDVRTGAVQWSVAHAPAERIALLSSDLVVLEHGQERLSACSRADGRVLWTANVGSTEWDIACVAGPDVLYVAGVVAGWLELTVFDPLTGARRGSARVRIPPPLWSDNGMIDGLWVREEGVYALVTTTSDRAVIVRFAD